MNSLTLQTVEKAIKILEIISIEPKSQNELEKISGFNRSSVRRIVYTLMDNGYVEKNENTGKYKIGLKVVELSSIRLNQVELKTEAAPILRELSLRTNQVCHMGIYSDYEVVYIDKVQPINSISMFSSIGKRLPVYSSSLGKVLLSEFSDHEILDILNSIKLLKKTQNTLVHANDILAEIKRVQTAGNAVDNEENEKGIFCIGAPIYDYRKKIIAAISTSGNNREYIKDGSEIIDLVKTASYEISKRLGYKK